MSLEKAISAGKEHRKPYRRSGRFDRSCRPHGGCPYCKNNRFVSVKRADEKTKDDIADILEDGIIKVSDISIHSLKKEI